MLPLGCAKDKPPCTGKKKKERILYSGFLCKFFVHPITPFASIPSVDFSKSKHYSTNSAPDTCYCISSLTPSLPPAAKNWSARTRHRGWTQVKGAYRKNGLHLPHYLPPPPRQSLQHASSMRRTPKMQGLNACCLNAILGVKLLCESGRHTEKLGFF